MLSDVCSDTLNNMAEDLVNYSDFGYCPKKISIFVDAMYSLAKLGFQLDTPPSVVHQNPKLVVHSLVLGAILEVEIKSNSNLAESKLKMLAELSKVHKKTANGLEEIYKDVTQNSDSYTLIINPSVISQLNEIRKYQKEELN